VIESAFEVGFGFFKNDRSHGRALRSKRSMT
jgi:hypothetical protein